MRCICENCGKEFNTYSGKRSVHHYCSKECFNEHRKNLIVVKCDYCGKDVIKFNNTEFKKSKNHFCSIECANTYQKRNKLELICKVCGKKFYRPKSWLNQKKGYYCSLECRNKDDE